MKCSTGERPLLIQPAARNSSTYDHDDHNDDYDFDYDNDDYDDDHDFDYEDDDNDDHGDNHLNEKHPQHNHFGDDFW